MALDQTPHSDDDASVSTSGDKHSIAKCNWARAYYQLQTSRGHGHHAAVRALAFKWIRILFVCWQTRTPYDEARHLRQLQHRASPLCQYLQAT